MALDPLKFAVAIQDLATKQLEDIETKLKSLKDHTIKLNVEGTEKIKEALNIDNLAEQIRAAKQALQGNSFDTFEKHMRNAAEAVNLLTENLGKFETAIKNDSGLRNYLAGIGEAIRYVRQSMGQMNIVSSGVQVRPIAESFSQAETVTQRYVKLLFDVENQLTKIGKVMAKGDNLGFSSTILNGSFDSFDNLRKVISNIISGTPVDGRIYEKNAENLRPLLANFAQLKSAYKDVISEAEKYLRVTDKTVSQGKVNLFSNQNTEEIRKQIDAVRALYMRIKELQGISVSNPKSWNELLFGGNWKKYDGSYQEQMEVFRSTFLKVQKELNEMSSRGIDISGYQKQLNALFETYEKFASLQPIDIAKKLGLEHLRGYTGPMTAADDAVWASLKRQAEIQEVAGEAAKRHQRKLEELTNAFAQHDAQLAKSQRIQENDNHARQKNVQTIRQQAEELVKTRMEMLRSQAGDLSKLLSNGKGKLGAEQYDAVRNALRGVREEMRQIDGIMQRIGSYSTRTLFDVGRGSMNYAALISELQKYIAELERGSKATQQFASEEQKLAQSIVKSTQEMFSQSQILNDLKSMATQYLGVWGAQQFMHNIIEIGGQLEMQRLSIAAILGDAAQANDLFEKIKGLAIQSPFGVVELDQMTKQLTAYGFQYHELFDMTKRLADISAATGTGVDRLALALGHVRSEAALSGYTLRQFSMANIPLAQKLSDRLSEIEKRFVSVADVRKRVRNKEIGYEDVVAVLKDLTDEGGMFYKAQEIMSGSVKAKFKNLKDAMDIMYGEMAESKMGDALKEVANILTSLTRKWEQLGAAIAVVAGAWAIKKGATFLSSNAMLAYSNSVTKLNMNLGSLTAQEMRELAYSGQLTKQKLLEAVATGSVTVEDAKLAAAKWNLTEAQLQEIANGTRTVASMTANSIATSKYTVAQLRAIAAARAHVAGNKALALSLNVLQTNLKLAAASIRGFLAAAWPIALITAGVEAWTRYKQQSEQAANAANAAFEKGEESVRNLNEAIEKLPEYKIIEGVANLDEGALRNGIKEAMKELQNYNPIRLGDIVEKVNKTENGKPVMDLAKQYEYLRGQVEETRKELEEYQRTALAQEAAANNTKGFLGLTDNVFEDLKDYFKSKKDFQDELDDFYSDNKIQLKEFIDNARLEDEAFRNSTQGMNSYSEVLKELIENREKYNDTFNKLWRTGSFREDGLVSAWKANIKIGEQRKEAESELDDWSEGLKKKLEGTFGYDFSKLTKEQFNNVRRHIWEFSNSEELSQLDEETKKWIRNYLGQKWNITFSSNTEEMLKEFDEMQDHIEKLVGQNWVIKLKLQTVGSFEEEYDQLNKNVKEAKETIKKLAPAINKGKKKRTEEIENGAIPLSDQEKEYYDAYLKLTKSKEAAEKEGFKLDALEYKDKSKGGGGKKEDKYAKEVRERVRVIKEAADAFQYWRDKVGDKGAWSHVQEEFGDVLAKIGITADNVNDLKGNLKDLDPLVSKIKDPKVKLETEKEIAKEAAKLDRKDFEKNSEEFLSRMKIELDSLTQAWSLFNNVREATGDIELAVQLSGVDFANGNNRNIADALKDKIQKELSSIGDGLTIDFDMKLSDEDIKKKVQAAIPKESEDRIDAIVEAYKKWRDLQRDLVNGDIQSYARFLGSLVDVESLRRRNQEEYNRVLEETNRLLKENVITQQMADKRIAAAGVDLETKNKQNEEWYTNLYKNYQVMAKDEFDQAYNAELQNLNDQYEHGKITLKDYTDQVDNLNKIASEFSLDGFLGIKGGVGSYLSDGVQGLIGYYQKRASKARTDYGEDSDEAKKWQDRADSLAKMQKAAEQVTKVFQDLSSGADMLSKMFDALGMDGAANAFGDAAGILGGMAGGAQSLSGLGPWGMAAGAAIGGITSLAELHDKKRERQIEELRRDVQKIDNTLNLIKSLRERTLGYDNGDMRRQLAAQYKAQMKTLDLGGLSIDLSPAASAMYEYYSRGGLEGSGYQQELNALKKQREDYQEMYDAERDKKKSSNEALEEYKAKMAELDMTIQNFSKDLANELFSIDLKGWADQIGDALMTAFENGEDAAKAFKDTVQDIMRQVLRNMLNVGIIERMMDKLQKKLFGENGEGGSFDATNPEGTIDAAMRDVAEFFGDGGEGQKMIEATKTFYDRWEEFMRSQGLTLDNSSSGSSASGSIKSITEQTADLLASYLNAVRADVSVNRAMIAQYFPEYYKALTSGNDALRGIENHTAAIMRSNEAIERSNQAILDRIDGLKNKTWKVPMG